MPTLTRDAILAVQDLVIEPLEVPEWGGTVHLRSMTAGERDRFEALVTGPAGGEAGTPTRLENIRAHLAALTLCDPAGQPLFTPEDVAALAGKSAAAMDRVFEAASRLNGLTPKDVQELGKT